MRMGKDLRVCSGTFGQSQVEKNGLSSTGFKTEFCCLRKALPFLYKTRIVACLAFPGARSLHIPSTFDFIEKAFSTLTYLR